MLSAPPTSAQILVGLALAALLGGCVGLQRQVARKPAGLRTHLLIALGACAFTETGRLMGSDRVAAGVLTGIGFLGAGAIIRQGYTPHGLTTAASIWSVAAVGVACGVTQDRSYLIAGVTTLLVIFALSLADARIARLIKANRKVEIAVTFDIGSSGIPVIVAAMGSDVHAVNVTDSVLFAASERSVVLCVGLALVLQNDAALVSVLERVALLEGVQKVEVTDEVSSS